jgi:molybdopterin converting factor small subunit
MPDVRVLLPATITTPQPPREIACEAADVQEALREVAAQAPRYAQRLFYKDRLLVGVLVNGRHIPPGEALVRRLADGDRVEVLPPVAGG